MAAQPLSDQDLDVVQHPTLGTLKFPKTMEPDERNQIIDSMMPRGSEQTGVPALKSPAVKMTGEPSKILPIADSIGRFGKSLGKTFGLDADAPEPSMGDKVKEAAKVGIGGPLIPAVQGLYQGAKRSIGELGEAGKAALSGDKSGAAYHGIKALPIVGPGMDKAADEYADKNYAGELGTLTGTAIQAAPAIADPVINATKGAGTAIRSAAIGDLDAAALRGLQVGPKSPKTLGTLRSIDTARPYLQGAKNLEDLQGKIPAAKAEIWAPYQQAVEGIGDRPVKGPDGITTVRDLEAERLQLSALNRGLKKQLPEAIQLAQQKGMTQAELLAREKAVVSALDPELSKTGIDPKAIRKTFGGVSEVGGRVSGKSTLIEKPQESGLGKIANLSLEHPLQAPGKILGGIRDIAAGRPLFEAKPTDLGIREGFRLAGPKPNLGEFRPPTVAGLLPKEASPSLDIPMSSHADIFPDQLPSGKLKRKTIEGKK